MKKDNYIIDTHTHIGYWPNLTKTQNDLLTSNRNFNINYSLVSFDGTEFKEHKRGRILNQILASKKCLKFVKENKHLGMLIWVRPHLEKNIEEVDSFISKHLEYIHGIKFHPRCSRLRITDPRFLPYLELARKYKLPILVHTANDTYSKIKYLEKIAKQNPDVIFIAAHLELGTNNVDAINLLATCDNVYGDTAWVNMESLLLAKKLNVINKIMFGTDNPIDGYDTLNNEIYQNYFNNKIKLTKKDYQNIMYKTALKVYKIKTEDLY